MRAVDRALLAGLMGVVLLLVGGCASSHDRAGDDGAGGGTGGVSGNSSEGGTSGASGSDSAGNYAVTGPRCPDGIYEGDFTVRDAEDLESFAGYTSITGDFEVGAPALDDLSGLSCLTSIEGSLAIEDCDALINLNGLSKLKSVGPNGLHIMNNPTLTDLRGLSNLVTVDGNLNIGWNDALLDLDGLNNISSIPGRMTIIGNTVLENLHGLSELTSVGGDFVIPDNPALTDLDGLNNLANIGGGLYIWDNIALPTCETERIADEIGLTNIGGPVEICGNLADTCGSEPCTP